MTHYKNKFNDKIIGLVVDATNEIIEMFKEHNLRNIQFMYHPNIDAPFCVFDDGTGEEYKCLKATEIALSPDYSTIIIISDETNWQGYLDGFYGDFFDVAQSIGDIYKSVVEVIEENNFAEVELN